MNILMKSEVGQLPKIHGIIVPKGGWKPNTVYLVRVAWRSSNPVYRALLHVGFVDKGGQQLSGYCLVWNHSMQPEFAGGAYYLEAERELCALK